MIIKALKFTSIGTVFCFCLAYVCWTAAGVNKDSGIVKGLRTTYSKENTKEIIVRNGIPIVGVKKIDTHGTSMDLRIEAATDGLLTYSLVASKKFYKPEDLKVEILGDTVKITLNQENKNGKFELNANTEDDGKEDSEFNFNVTESGGARLTLKIPQNIVEMSVETVSGDVSVESLTLDAFTAKSTSGDVKLKASKVNNVNITSTSGDLKLDGDLKQLNYTVTSGDVELKIENPSPIINYKSVSGDIEVKFKKTADLQMNYTSVSGDYEVKANDGKDTMSGSKAVNAKIGAGTGSINVSTVSGDFEIKQ